MAEGKVRALVRCGAQVRVVSPDLTPALRRWARQGKIRWIRRIFRAWDLSGVRLVVAATDQQSINEQASWLARRRGIWINVVDQPRLCSVIYPSVVRRGKLVLAISTGGISPALAKRIRIDLQRRYGPEFNRLLAGMGRVRRRVQERIPSVGGRKRLFEKALAAYFRVIEEGVSSRGGTK